VNFRSSSFVLRRIYLWLSTWRAFQAHNFVSVAGCQDKVPCPARQPARGSETKLDRHR
jgi:hypothetical protein